jgi:hypothetical protein
MQVYKTGENTGSAGVYYLVGIKLKLRSYLRNSFTVYQHVTFGKLSILVYVRVPY